MTADEAPTMGTTGAPGIPGADAIDDPAAANGSARGVETTLGGELNDPMLPFDRRLGSDESTEPAPDGAGEPAGRARIED